MLLCLSSLRWKSPQDNQDSTSFTVCPFNDCPQDIRHPSPSDQVSVVVLPTLGMLKSTSAALCPGIQCHSSGSPLCQLMAPGLLGQFGAGWECFQGPCSPGRGQHGCTVAAGAGFTAYLGTAWSWLLQGGAVHPWRGPGDWCREGTGPEGQLGNRARSGQEPISRARCPSLVPAFIRCSESCATMALSQLFSPPTDFPTKLLFCLRQFPQHHLRNPSVSAQPLVLRLAPCCQHSRNSGELQRAAAAWGRAVGHGCLTGWNEAAGAALRVPWPARRAGQG